MSRSRQFWLWVKSMIALLSIRPEHAENIFAGRKTYEYRRKVFARTDVRTVLVYCTKPVGKLVGEFDIDGILQSSPRSLWKQTHRGSGISERYFYEYFAGCKLAYALRITKVREYKESINPQDLIARFSPPQSFMYVEERFLLDRSGKPGVEHNRDFRYIGHREDYRVCMSFIQRNPKFGYISASEVLRKERGLSAESLRQLSRQEILKNQSLLVEKLPKEIAKFEQEILLLDAQNVVDNGVELVELPLETLGPSILWVLFFSRPTPQMCI